MVVVANMMYSPLLNSQNAESRFADECAAIIGSITQLIAVQFYVVFLSRGCVVFADALHLQRFF